jgi:hypothetical protein
MDAVMTVARRRQEIDFAMLRFVDSMNCDAPEI